MNICVFSVVGSAVDAWRQSTMLNFTHFFHVEMDFAQPFIAAIITPMIRYCIGGLVFDEQLQSWVRIPCQFQACCGR